MGMNPRLLRPAASGFDPRRIAGLALWLDAADSSTISLDGSSNVEEWRDKSGNNRHAGQTTGANRPDYASTRNGRSVVGFGGSPERLVTTSFSLPQPQHLFVVARPTSSSQNFIAAASGTVTCSLYRRTGTQLGMSSGNGEIFATLTSPDQWCLLTALYNAANSVLQFNGTTVATGNAGTRDIFVGLGLGSSASLTNYLVGDIAEVILYGSELSGAQVGAVNSYLNRKWAL
jgi:hypothetical protein